MQKLSVENFTGCLLGGAVGDALGAPTEFMTLTQIVTKFGSCGVTEYVEFKDGIGRITDDTQMTLFTAEAMLRSIHRSKIRGVWGGDYLKISHDSYLRWLHTQQYTSGFNFQSKSLLDGWVIGQSGLFSCRAPGNTCINALRSGKCGTIKSPINNSKGCGGIMRVAPVGLIKSFEPPMAFQIAAELAAITHGHPNGYLSAGTFAAIIAFIRLGLPLPEAIGESLKILRSWKNCEETNWIVRKAIEMSETTNPTFENIEKLGGGWIGEEALAIAIYCSLTSQDSFEKGIILSINHGGDTDSTGAITGNLLGLLLGQQAIPQRWLRNLEMNELISQIGSDLFVECKYDLHEYDKIWAQKYPEN